MIRIGNNIIERQLYSQVVQSPQLHDTSQWEREIMRLEIDLENTPAPPQLKDRNWVIKRVHRSFTDQCSLPFILKEESDHV